MQWRVQGRRWLVLPPFSFVGTLPELPTGGDEVKELDGYRYHIFTEPRDHQLAWYNVDADVEVVAFAGGADGDDSSYTAEGEGGLGGEYLHIEQQAVAADYQIMHIRPGGPGEVTEIRLPDHDVTLQSGVDTEEPHELAPEWAIEILGMSQIGGSGQRNVGPVAATTYGGGGGGGFQLLEPYPQESYTHHWTTGGPYNYDCSYGARHESYHCDNTNVTGDQRPCNPCPGHAHICHNPCDCMFAWYHAGGESWASRGQMGCPGGWHECGCNCCTTQPVYCDRYHCDHGGTPNGSTCSKTCQGDNTQHHSETRYTDCVSGMAPDGSRTCIDVRSPGGGAGKGGVVVLRYPIPTRINPVNGTGVPVIY